MAFSLIALGSEVCPAREFRFANMDAGWLGDAEDLTVALRTALNSGATQVPWLSPSWLCCQRPPGALWLRCFLDRALSRATQEDLVEAARTYSMKLATTVVPGVAFALCIFICCLPL